MNSLLRNTPLLSAEKYPPFFNFREVLFVFRDTEGRCVVHVKNRMADPEHSAVKSVSQALETLCS